MKIISWNVNGIRAALKKGFLDYIKEEDPDIICLQETKAHREQAEVDLKDYTEYWSSAVKKGYSGTAIFTRVKPIDVNVEVFDSSYSLLKDKYGDATKEGRVITAEFEKFYLVNIYTPNSKPDLSRLQFRYKSWDPSMLKYLKNLEKSKPVIFCGDLNVAHKEIDLARPYTNHKNAGFTNEEREGFDNYVNADFVDTFRMFNKEGGNYTWWSHFAKARERNIGWRIDYFCVSKLLSPKVKDAFIRMDVMGSDHCPIGIVLDS